MSIMSINLVRELIGKKININSSIILEVSNVFEDCEIEDYSLRSEIKKDFLYLIEGLFWESNDKYIDEASKKGDKIFVYVYPYTEIIEVTDNYNLNGDDLKIETELTVDKFNMLNSALD